MSRLRALLTSPAHSWTLRRLIKGEELPAGERYLSVHLNAAHLEFSRRGTKKFHGLVGTAFELDSLADGRSRITGVHGAEWLAGIDGAHLDRLVATDVRLYGPRPYIGGDISYELGLFARPEADLAAPFVTFLTKVAEATGGLGPLVESGVELLFDGDRTALQIGGFGTLSGAGTYALLAGEGIADFRDGGLHRAGQPVTESYLVFTVSGSCERTDWASIPELQASWADCQRAIRDGNHRRVDEELMVFRRTVLTCHELLVRDAERIVESAKRLATAVLSAGPTARGADLDVPGLDALDPYTR
ncbi:hypothetical protein [Actinophytocola sp.]|uniref:hypothetical protein n=1 Tax=Actinophytocola sp. TaxID=1872138 RepID=UPI0038997EB0